jgi:anti-anti-sigma regulatory factor
MTETANPACFKIDEKTITETLLRVLDGADGEIVLDFSSVERVDTNALRALEKLAREAAAKNVKISLLEASVGVYKVLKLTQLSRRFAFLN